jgi:ATP-binding cassette subfamily C (CFTR/MRP) protein 1
LQIFVTGLHHIEYTRNRVSSAILLFYWLFILVVDGIKLRTRIMNEDYNANSTQFVFFASSYGLSFIIFVLENMDKPKSQYIMLEEDEVCVLRAWEINKHILKKYIFLQQISLIHQRKRQISLVD